jgi:hypothetical protein
MGDNRAGLGEETAIWRRVDVIDNQVNVSTGILLNTI